MRIGRIVEPCIQVLEQPSRHASEHVQFIDQAQEKGLVEHRRDERVRHPMPRDIQDGDAAHRLATLQILDDVEPPVLDAALDSGVQIEPLLEVHIDHVVAADHAIQGERAPVNVNATQLGDIPWLRDQAFCDCFEILQLARQLPYQVAPVGMHNPRFEDGHGGLPPKRPPPCLIC